MPDLLPEIEPAVLEARLKEADAASPAGIERAKARGSLVVRPDRNAAQAVERLACSAASPGTGAPLLRQVAHESELRGYEPRARERIAA